MATTCPKCGAVLKDDYGMVTCPACGVIVFIDMDGLAHFGSAEGATGSKAATTPRLEEPPAPPDLDTPFEFLTPEEPDDYRDLAPIAPIAPLAPPAEPEAAEFNDFAFSTPDEPLPTEPVDLAPPAPEEPEPLEEIPEAEFSMDVMLGYAEPEPEALAPIEELVPDETLGEPGDPLGLNAYANSEISQGRDGMLTFRILISGIDSKELRDSLRQALEDSRFGWNVASVMGQIRSGSLRIDNVSPVKASILVNRIKRLAVQIRWEQYAITQMEGAEDETPDLGQANDSDESGFSALLIVVTPFSARAHPWAEHVGHLAMLSKQIESNELEIHELIEKKNHTEDAKAVADIMKEIGTHHEALEKAEKEYEEERQHVRFEHPEKNDQIEHVYVRHDVKSIEEMEAGDTKTLDGHLDHLKARVLATYPLPEKKPVVSALKLSPRKPASVEDDDETTQKIKLVK